MRLCEFDNSNSDGRSFDGIPDLWIPHKDDTRPRSIDISIDKLGELLSNARANIHAKYAIDQARGYEDWQYSDDLAIDLREITSAKEVIGYLDSDLYRLMARHKSRPEIAKIYEQIVNDPAWLRFIIHLESILRKYVISMDAAFDNIWSNQQILNPRQPPRLPAGRAEYSDDADSFIDKMKNMSEDTKYNPKTLPKLSTIIDIVKMMSNLITHYMQLIIDPCLKRLSIESPYITSVFNTYKLRASLVSYYAGDFSHQVLAGINELEQFARETLK